MPGQKTGPNKGLLLLAVLLCLILGGIFTRSSAQPSPLNEQDMFVAEDVPKEPAASKSTKADLSTGTEHPKATESPEISVSPTPTPAEPEKEVSPQAEKGVWTPSGSNWTFLIDGIPYTGWLHDTDGKTYYFNADGIMQTGWIEVDQNRYYMDLDGIMQTRTQKIDGKTYSFSPDGVLKETSSPVTPSPTPVPKKKAKKEKTAKKAVALTFDDGPSSFTDRILDCLEENNAKATFFMVGQEIANFPDTVKRMDALGCELGNHTYSHVDLTTLKNAEEISREVGGTDQALLKLVDKGASVLRPPYGSINDKVTASVGTPMILWSIDTLDWKTQDPQQTVDTVLSQVEDGSIILMHDIFETSALAAETLIPRLIQEGYELLTIHDLAASKGITLKTGIAYGALNSNS